LPEKDPQDEFLYAQLCWARKDFTCAIAKAEGVVAITGAQTKPKVLKLLADAYTQKGDSVSGKKYIDQYFAREKADELIPFDYVLKAKIYSKFPGNDDMVFSSFEQAVKLDTVVENKVDILKEAADFFKKTGQRVKEGDVMVKLLEIKPKPTINDWFDAGRAYYFGKEYSKSRDIFVKFVEKYPAEIYGYEWKLNNSRIIDTVKKDSIAVPDALALLEFAQKDTAKYGKQVSSAAYFLALYHAGKNEREKAVEYLTIMKAVERDPAKQESIQNNIDVLSKPAPKTPTQRTGGSPAKTSNSKPGPTAKPKTTVSANTGAVKK
jgi:tetratricopeptide (TPR) repeat protein